MIWPALKSIFNFGIMATQTPLNLVGYILSLEGADSILNIDYLERAYKYGLRAVGPAHYGRWRYAPGTDATGLMGTKGHELLKEMERLNIILDATHLCDDSFWEALANFNGHIWASHNNCRALVNHNRQYGDEQIKELISRGAVIGVALDAWMMVPNWIRGISDPKRMNCSLDVMIDHVDHICQLAGNTLHIGIGSDLDGAFGREQCPYDLETIADLQNIPALLKKRWIQWNRCGKYDAWQLAEVFEERLEIILIMPIGIYFTDFGVISPIS